MESVQLHNLNKGKKESQRCGRGSWNTTRHVGGKSLPPSNPRVGYRANEGIATPSQHQTAELYEENQVRNVTWLP